MRRHFLTPRLLRDWLVLFNRLLGNDTGGERRSRRRRLSVSRRKLIVVSNRGPVSYGRDDDGARIARRGGGGLVTALRGLVAAPRRHLDRERDHRRGPRRSPAASVRGDGARRLAYRLRLVAHDPQAYDCFYNVVANPTLWFLQHSSGSSRTRPRSTAAFHDAWATATSRVNRALRRRRSSTSSSDDPDAAVFFHDYHLYLAPRLVRERSPDARAGALRPHPVAAARLWRVLPRTMRRAIHDGLLANDVVGFHTEPLARELHRSARHRRRESTGRGRRARRRTLVTRIRSRSTRPSSTSSRSSAAVLGRGARLVAAPAREAHRARRPHRSVEEHRPRLPRFELYLDAHPEMHGRVGMLALLDPSRQDIPEYAEYLGAIQREARARQRALPHERLAADRPADRATTSRVGRRVQAVRRAARERDLRRA